MEMLDHKTDPTKLWRPMKAIDGKSMPKAENEAITFDRSQVSSPSRSDRQLFQPTVHHFKAGQTHFFPGEISNGNR